MCIPKRLLLTSVWALALFHVASCGGSLSAGGATGGVGGTGTGVPVSAGNTSAASTDNSVSAGGAGARGTGGCGACPILVCEPSSMPVTKPGECCPSSCSALIGGSSVPPSSCEIDLDKFENNGYRTCAPNDNVQVAAGCPAEYDYEDGTSEVCGNFRLYAYGHDGRIGCAYDSTTGDLVGGFLWGLPAGGVFCRSYFAGPAQLASCPVPSTPFCRTDAGSAQGGAGEGGAAGSP